MNRILKGFAIGRFSLAGVLVIFPGIGVALRWYLPGSHDIYFRSELDVLDGVLSFLAALRIYRGDSRAWVFALVLAGLNLIGGVVASWLAFYVFSASWAAAWLAVILWLCWPSVRSGFSTPIKTARTT